MAASGSPRWANVDRARAGASRDAHVLERLGQPSIPQHSVGTLPLGQQQIVEIARALAQDARVLIMDEPTSALSGRRGRACCSASSASSRRAASSIVYISHHLEEVLEIADRVTVLRDGVVVGEAAADEVDLRWIVERMTGGRRSPPHVQPRRRAPAARAPVASATSLPPGPDEPLSTSVSFDVRAGEIVGLYGLMGAGRTELLEALLGVHADATGEVQLIGDADRRVGRRRAHRASGSRWCPRTASATGSCRRCRSQENMTLSSLGGSSARGYLSPARGAKAAADA